MSRYVAEPLVHVYVEYTWTLLTLYLLFKTLILFFFFTVAEQATGKA